MVTSTENTSFKTEKICGTFSYNKVEPNRIGSLQAGPKVQHGAKTSLVLHFL